MQGWPFLHLESKKKDFASLPGTTEEQVHLAVLARREDSLAKVELSFHPNSDFSEPLWKGWVPRQALSSVVKGWVGHPSDPHQVWAEGCAQALAQSALCCLWLSSQSVNG